MRVKAQNASYFLKFEMGEELVSSLTEFATEQNIHAATIQGIGALRDFELGYYALDQKEYNRRKYSEIVELISCNGNIAMRENKQFAHIHVCLGLPDFRAIGGHLFSGIVAVTAEVLLHPLPERMDRAYEEKAGLFLLDLPVWKAF